MSNRERRRNFLVQSAAVTAGALVVGTSMVQEATADTAAHSISPEAGEFPRTHAGLGGPIGSPTDRGKLVPGLRKHGLPPVPVTAPDLDKLTGEMVRGAREFHLRATPARRELLPGI